MLQISRCCSLRISWLVMTSMENYDDDGDDQEDDDDDDDQDDDGDDAVHDDDVKLNQDPAMMHKSITNPQKHYGPSNQPTKC